MKTTRRRAGISAGIALLLSLTLGGLPGCGSDSSPSATARDASGFPPIGFHINGPWSVTVSDEDSVADINAGADAGLEYVRIAVYWDQLEKQRGVYDATQLARLDTLITAAAARGLKVITVVITTPAWARPLAGIRTTPARDAADSAAFYSLLATRYGESITAFEVGNENNHWFFAGGIPNPALYTEHLKLIYPAIKAANPRAIVIINGLANEGDSLLTLSPLTYLRGIYAAGGKGYFDAAAMHPYSWYHEGPWETSVDAMREEMVAMGDGDLQIWITENGAGTFTGSDGMTEAEQVQYLESALNEAAARSFVGPFIIYSIRDTGTSAATREQNFGLLKHDYTPKQSYLWVKTLTGH